MAALLPISKGDEEVSAGRREEKCVSRVDLELRVHATQVLGLGCHYLCLSQTRALLVTDMHYHHVLRDDKPRNTF